MPARIDIAQPAAQHRNRAAIGRQRRTMANAVDADRQTAGDGETATRQLLGEMVRPTLAVMAELPAADHSELRLQQHPRIALDQQKQRRVVDLSQAFRIAGRPIVQHTVRRLLQPTQGGRQIDRIHSVELCLLPFVQSQLMQHAARLATHLR